VAKNMALYSYRRKLCIFTLILAKNALIWPPRKGA